MKNLEPCNRKFVLKIGQQNKHTMLRCVYEAEVVKSSFIQTTNMVSLAKDILKEGNMLSFDERYLNRDYKPESAYQTPFKEILIAPISEIVPDNSKVILGNVKKQEELSLEEIAQYLKNNIKNYIITNINPKKPTLISHSSGYDSRIISSILREIRLETGRKYLGDVHFRCHEPEGDSFIEIMKKQGWDKTEYSVFPQEEMDNYDIGRCDIAYHLNGFAPYVFQMNWWRDIVPYGEEKNWNAIFGAGGGELFHYPSIKMPPMRNYQFCENKLINGWLNYFAYPGEWESILSAKFGNCLLPYFSYDYLRMAVQIPEKYFTVDETAKAYQNVKPDMIRMAMLRTFDVDVTYIDYLGHDYKKGYNWAISPQRKKQMEDMYYNSEFYKSHGHKAGQIDVTAGVHSWEAKLWGFMLTYEAIYNEMSIGPKPEKI